jgi:hypothetical protein
MCFLISTQNTKTRYDSLRIILGCLNLAVRGVTTGLLRAYQCRELAEKLPELWSEAYKGHIVSVLQYTTYGRNILRGRYVHLRILDDDTRYRYAVIYKVRHLSLWQQETVIVLSTGHIVRVRMEGLDRGRVSIMFRGKETCSSNTS